MPPKDDKNLDKLAKDIINQYAAIVRTAQIHDPSNVAVVKSIERLIDTMKGILETEESIMIEIVGESIYMNEARIKFSMDSLLNFDFLAREFKKLKLGSITFSESIRPDSIKEFVKASIDASFSPEPFDDLSQYVMEIPGITVGPPRQEKKVDSTQVHDMKTTVKHTYFNAVSFTGGVMNKIRAGEKIDVKKSKRVVQSMVDMLMDQEELLLGMTAIKDYDDYTYHHCVNVSILSIAIGQKLAFTKSMLLELGLVALFHDVGKMQIPTEVLNKPSSFTEEEWKMVKRHPMWGVRAILKMKGFDLISVKSAIVAFEHHIRLDDSGYPPRKFSHDLDLFSKIVSLADQYDGMTSARVYSRTPMTPEKALSLMQERSGTQLDPLLFKFFVNMVGVYPVGTGVMLNTRQLALVYGNNMMFPEAPKVMLISDEKGKKIEGKVIDLSEKDENGKFKRSIISTLDPAKYNINLAEYLL